MFLERNPFSKDVNDHIKGIFESDIEKLKATGKKSDNQNSQFTTWEKHLTKPILNQLMTKDKVSTCETSYLHRIRCTFTRRDVPNYLSKLLPFIEEELFPDKNVKSAGGFYYPPGGFMGWHTNCESPRLRFYVTYSSHANKSFFRYLNERGEIVTDYDDKGVTLRTFNIPRKPSYFWHCAGSDCDRYSFGSRLSDK